MTVIKNAKRKGIKKTTSPSLTLYEGNGKARGKEILDNAAYLMATKGYNGVGMRMIAESVGMREASLYNHFPSKEHMLYQICLCVSKFYAETREPMLAADNNFEEQLEELVKSHLTVVWSDRYYVITMIRSLDKLSPNMADEINMYRHKYQKRFQSFISKGKAAGVFEVDDVWLAGIAILSMLNGIFSWFREDGSLSIEDIASRYTRLIHQFLMPKQEL